MTNHQISTVGRCVRLFECNGGCDMAKRILLVDDEPLILKGLKYTLEQEGYETESAVDGEEALDKFFPVNLT